MSTSKSPNYPEDYPNACITPELPGPQPTMEAAKQFIRDQGFKGGGYGINSHKKGDLNKKTGDYSLYHIICSCGGKQRPSVSTGKRLKPSKKTGCEMGLVCKRKDDGLWYTRWQTDKNGETLHLHNHLWNNPDGDVTHRGGAWPQEVIDYIATQVITGISANEVALQAQELYGQKYNFKVNAKDISNNRQKHLKILLDGRDPVEWLLERLDLDGVYHEELWDDNNNLIGLFLCPKECLEEWVKSPWVVMADNTHNTIKTNQYMCNFVGMSGGGWAPHLCTALLNGQGEEQYGWALDCFNRARKLAPAKLLGPKYCNPDYEIPAPTLWVTDRDFGFMKALREKCPGAGHFLCKWHVNMNVALKTRKHFPVGTRTKHKGKLVYQQNDMHKDFIRNWNEILDQRTESLYTTKRQLFERKWQASGHGEAVRYAVNWLDLFKEKIVRCYQDQYSHFYVFTTSPCEGVHGGVKSFLPGGKADLIRMYFGLRKYWKTHHKSIAAEWGKQAQLPFLFTSTPFYQDIRDVITAKALWHTTREKRKLPTPPEEMSPEDRICRCPKSHAVGIPCKHQIQRRIFEGAVQFEDYHPFWHRYADPRLAPPVREKRDIKKGFYGINPGGRPAMLSTRGIQTAKSGHFKGNRKQSSNSTRRLPSAHEYPDERLVPGTSSSAANNFITTEAPPQAPAPLLALPTRAPIDSTTLSIERLEVLKIEDLYKAGTKPPRASKRTLSRMKSTAEANNMAEFELQDLFAHLEDAPIPIEELDGEAEQAGDESAAGEQAGAGDGAAKELAADEEDKTGSEDEFADAPVVDKGKGKEKEKAVYFGDENEGFEDVDNFNSPPVTPQRPAKRAKVHGSLLISPKSQRTAPPVPFPAMEPIDLSVDAPKQDKGKGTTHDSDVEEVSQVDYSGGFVAAVAKIQNPSETTQDWEGGHRFLNWDDWHDREPSSQ